MSAVFILNKVSHNGVSVNSLVGVYSEFHKAMKSLGATRSTKVGEVQYMVQVGDDLYTITLVEVL
jgi:hypothetical protein